LGRSPLDNPRRQDGTNVGVAYAGAMGLALQCPFGIGIVHDRPKNGGPVSWKRHTEEYLIGVLKDGQDLFVVK